MPCAGGSDMGERETDLSDLPPEVIAQLSKRPKPLDAKILALFEEGALDLDHAIIGLWRLHKISLTRDYLMSKLYQLMLKGHLVAVPGQRATYRLPARDGRAT